MARSITALEKELMALPSQERARIAHDLITSLDNGVEEDVEAYWSEEIERRLAQTDNGDVELLSAEETFRRARDELKK